MRVETKRKKLELSADLSIPSTCIPSSHSRYIVLVESAFATVLNTPSMNPRYYNKLKIHSKYLRTN
jgi:hypothetical protein